MLETAGSFEDMDLPGRRLHPLKGDREVNVYLAVTLAVFENVGKNKQEKVMDKLSKNSNVAENGESWIKTERFKVLQCNYIKPELSVMDVDTKCNN